MRALPLTLVSSLSLLSFSCGEKPTSPPNIIYILADDLGYGDLGCYGQQLIPTPNIDRLAKEGILFTRHYAGSTVSAPSRSSLMTGQHTGHTPIRGNRGMKPEGQYPLSGEAFTVAEMLKQAGYTNGAFGKWGLGPPGSEGDPLHQGFDEFYGFICQGLAHSYYPWHLWHNDQKIILKENADTLRGAYAPFLIQEKALEFIENNKDKHFFCYIPSIIPHAELIAPEEYMNIYRGRFLPEKEYKGCDPGCDRFRTGGYESQMESHAAFAAMIHILDEQVGQIIDKIDELGLRDNTIIIFTSDNGPHVEGGADPDYFNSNGPLKGYKRDLYEGGIRVPMLVRWPEKIKAGSTTDHVSAFWDVLPTMAELTGVTPPENIDGISFLPTLTGQNEQKQHDYLYWVFYEKGGKQAILKNNWKLVLSDVQDPEKTTTELFDLNTDLAEENNLATENPGLVEELKQLILDSHTVSAVWGW